MKILSLIPVLALLAAPLKGADWESAPGLYAVFQTSKGRIVCRLFEKEAPFTVDNFTGLATGQKMFIDPKDNAAKKAPFYNDTVFHRVIPNFMIQGGDRLGQGVGGPGYKFNDETNNGLKFDRNGLLAMANAGPATNGSQFFITDSRSGNFPSHLNGKHTVFGAVVEGQSVVEAIADTNVQPGQGDASAVVKLTKLEIKRVEEKAAPK